MTPSALGKVCWFEAAAPGLVAELCLDQETAREQCGWGGRGRGKDKTPDLNVQELDVPGGYLDGDAHFRFSWSLTRVEKLNNCVNS